MTAFSITAAAKTMAHPYFGMGHPVGYVVDGVEGGVISLTRGTTYTFNVNTPGHPFYFSTDPSGGPGMPGRITTGVTNDLVQNGAVTFTPDASHPAMFWYQCNAHAQMGWHVVLTP